MHYAELYQHGLPPIVGGALDQARWFTLAAAFIWNERDHQKHLLQSKAH